MRALRLSLILLFPFHAGCRSQETAVDTAEIISSGYTVPTTYGNVKGYADPGTKAVHFLGIRYAAPPVRWQPPQPPTIGPGETNQFDLSGGLPPRCVETTSVYGFDFVGANSPVHDGSEDCLFLDVTVPPSASPRSNLGVLFFIYGGGSISGSPEDYPDPATLAVNENVIVVEVQYRVGMLGFLSLSALAKETSGSYGPAGTTGNYAYLDQIAGLKWVQQNIKNFGGNSDQVTIWGQSAGALSVCTLVASPLTKGLFQGAIMESGSCNSRSLSNAELIGNGFATLMGCASTDLPCLRALPWQAIVDNELMGIRGGADGDYGPTVDGYVLPQSTTSLLSSGQYNPVPMILGTNSVEAGLQFPKVGNIDDTINQLVISAYGTAAYQQLLAYYPPDTTGQEIPQLSLLSDLGVTCPAIFKSIGSLNASGHAPIYRYFFNQAVTYQLNGVTAEQQPVHGAELSFAFDQPPPPTITFISPKGDQLQNLQNEMVRYWSNFAKYGNPNIDDATALDESIPAANKTNWSATSQNNPIAMVLNAGTPLAVALPEQQVCTAISQLTSPVPSPAPLEGKPCPGLPLTAWLNAPGAANGGECSPLVPMYHYYRSFDLIRGDHFYTTNPNDPLTQSYTFEGIAFYVPSVPGYVPLSTPVLPASPPAPLAIAPVWMTYDPDQTCTNLISCPSHRYFSSRQPDGSVDVTASLSRVSSTINKTGSSDATRPGNTFRTFILTARSTNPYAAPFYECSNGLGGRSYWMIPEGTQCPDAAQGYRTSQLLGYVYLPSVALGLIPNGIAQRWVDTSGDVINLTQTNTGMNAYDFSNGRNYAVTVLTSSSISIPGNVGTLNADGTVSWSNGSVWQRIK